MACGSAVFAPLSKEIIVEDGASSSKEIVLEDGARSALASPLLVGA